MRLTFADADQWRTLLTLVVAMVLGGLVGLEREMQEKPAGMRTHMLVAGAASLLVSVDRLITARFLGDFGTSGVFRADPIGVIQAVVTGVAFLGAGTIIRQAEGEHVQGLTTAASLLFTAVLGIAVGLSLWIVAVGGVLLAWLTLRIVPRLERWLEQRSSSPRS